MGESVEETNVGGEMKRRDEEKARKWSVGKKRKRKEKEMMEKEEKKE